MQQTGARAGFRGLSAVRACSRIAPVCSGDVSAVSSASTVCSLRLPDVLTGVLFALDAAALRGGFLQEGLGFSACSTVHAVRAVDEGWMWQASGQMQDNVRQGCSWY